MSSIHLNAGLQMVEPGKNVKYLNSSKLSMNILLMFSLWGKIERTDMTFCNLAFRMKLIQEVDRREIADGTY